VPEEDVHRLVLGTADAFEAEPEAFSIVEAQILPVVGLPVE